MTIGRQANRTYDVIVIGLGAMGSAAAYHLSLRGSRVLGLEQYYPAHDKGSSHGSTRIIRKSAFEGDPYVPIGLRSYELWAQLEAETGRKLMTPTGGFFVGSPDERYVRGSIESAQKHGIEHEVLESRELQRRVPSLQIKPEQIAYSERSMGVVTPEGTIMAHQQLAQTRGAQLHFGETVLGWEADADRNRVRVTTNEGGYEAERLVIATGAWAPRTLQGMDLPLEIERHWIFWFEPREGALEQFRVNRFPMFNVVSDDGVAFSLWPAFGTESRLKATFIEGAAELCTPETMAQEVVREELERMERSVRAYAPDAAGRPVGAQACMFTNTSDRHFVISLHPKHANVAVAAGMSGNGFKYSAAVGEILADLAIDGSTSYDISLFSPSRFQVPTA